MTRRRSSQTRLRYRAPRSWSAPCPAVRFRSAARPELLTRSHLRTGLRRGGARDSGEGPKTRIVAGLWHGRQGEVKTGLASGDARPLNDRFLGDRPRLLRRSRFGAEGTWMRQILAARLACLFAGLAVGVAGCVRPPRRRRSHRRPPFPSRPPRRHRRPRRCPPRRRRLPPPRMRRRKRPSRRRPVAPSLRLPRCPYGVPGRCRGTAARSSGRHGPT